MLPELLLWLLPAAFVLHDAEEVFFLPGWLRRNRDELAQRFPRLSGRVLSHAAAISWVRFAAMAAEELAILSSVTLYSVISHDCLPWLALFLAFGVHLVVHIMQWIAVGRYIPVAATLPAALAYCGWGLCTVINSRLFTLRELLVCGVAGCAAAAVNLWLLHALAGAAGRKG